MTITYDHLSPFEQWMVQSNLKTIKETGIAAAEQVAILRANPRTLSELIRDHVTEEVDWTVWREDQKRQRRGQLLLEEASREWARIAAGLTIDDDTEDDDAE